MQSSSSLQRGFSLIELLLVISVVAILASIVALATPKIKEKAMAATCGSRMRVLHSALGYHLNDLGHWPQLPEEIYDNEKKVAEFWYDALEPYGMDSYEAWSCPSWIEQIKASGQSPEALELYQITSYHPTPFDEHPSTPLRWSHMPWAIEVGGEHPPGGGHVLMGNGQVISEVELQQKIDIL